jgi:hypothetical protein
MMPTFAIHYRETPDMTLPHELDRFLMGGFQSCRDRAGRHTLFDFHGKTHSFHVDEKENLLEWII